MRVTYDELRQECRRVLLQLSFSEDKAELCAGIFAANSRDGVYSHGLNRFPVFVNYVKEGLVDPQAEPECIAQTGLLEQWDGHLAPGMYNATHCMNRAISLAKDNGIGCVAIRNTSHWMRGGTYGWQAAEAGCIGICFTNAIAGMPAWGGKEPVLGNNPLVIAVPRKNNPVVLDMALSQFSYGKMQEYELADKELPVPGGYDAKGKLSLVPEVIRETKRALPIGFWKGSGLSLLLDMLVTSLSGGRSTARITADGKEYGVSQCFICIHPQELHTELVEEIIADLQAGTPASPDGKILYPGENTLRIRRQNELEGIPVNEQIWKTVLKM